MTTVELKSTTISKEHMDTVLWTIPGSILPKQNVIQASCSDTEIKGVKKSMYELKMEFSLGNTYVFKIYFLSRVTMDIKSEITTVKPIQGIIGSPSKYLHVQAHKWQYLNSFSINYNNCNDVVLRFTFTTKDNCVLHEELSDNIEDIFNDELFSDAAMKSADGVEYKVHKAILATRSAVLEAHFTHNTTESVTNVIESPFESEVLFEVLLFIYSNRVSKIYDMPEKLLAAADFYQLDSLKNYCEMVLCYDLTVENVIEYLQLAELYSLENLKKGILEFIMNDKRAYGITKTEAWTKLVSVTLIKFLYENVAKNV